MSNEKNLKPFTSDQSREEAVKNGAAGGIASGQSRREKRDLRRALEMLLEKEYKDKAGNSLTGTEAISAKLFEQAMKGNIKAFETLRDTVGQKPVDRVEQVNIDMEYQQSVEYVKRLMKEKEK